MGVEGFTILKQLITRHVDSITKLQPLPDDEASRT